MSRPDFIVPDFISDNDSDQIHDRMMQNLPPDISNMEGDFAHDFTMPTAIEVSQLMQFGIVRALMIAFPEYSWGEWMDLHGQQDGVERKPAVPAVGILLITAQQGTVVEQGTVVAVPAAGDMAAIEFQTMESVEFDADGEKEVPIEAVEAGTVGNVASDTITITALPINGVIAVTNPEKTSGGTDVENDDDYYDRIHAERADAQFYVGNDADYIKWAKQVPGIGDCIVDPSFDGPGTVRLILVDNSGRPASEQAVKAVYDHIVSPDDRSKRLLPTGTAKLTVEAAKLRAINYSCTGLELSGISTRILEQEFRKRLLDIYSEAKENGGVMRYNTARTALSTINGVKDFVDFRMDGYHANIDLAIDEYAETGMIEFKKREDDG